MTDDKQILKDEGGVELMTNQITTEEIHGIILIAMGIKVLKVAQNNAMHNARQRSSY